MKIGSIVQYEDWIGIVVATHGENLETDEEVMVLWSGMSVPFWEPVDTLKVICEDR